MSNTPTGAPRKAFALPSLNMQSIGIYGAAVAIFVIFGLLNPNFLTVGNLRDVAIAASINAIIGLGITFVIITGGIDLSVGSIASFVGIVAATLMVNGGVAPIIALLAGVGLGLACGTANGLLITKLKLPPFIATLGTMSVFQGFAYVVTDGKPVYNVPTEFVLMLNSYIGGVPVMVLIVAAVGVVSWLILRKTVFGENVIATGGSEETAWLSGIRVQRVKIYVYAISGGMAGLAGLILVARINAAQSEGGSPYLLTAIAAAVIGGANLMGGGPHRGNSRRRAYSWRTHQWARVAQCPELLRTNCDGSCCHHRGCSRSGRQGVADSETWEDTVSRDPHRN